MKLLVGDPRCLDFHKDQEVWVYQNPGYRRAVIQEVGLYMIRLYMDDGLSPVKITVFPDILLDSEAYAKLVLAL